LPTYFLLLIPAGLGFLVLLALGELLLHVILPGLVRIAVYFLDFLDRNTLAGTIGLIGFGLITIGFVFQIYGTYDGRQQNLDRVVNALQGPG
jgi:hypothetical protein